MIRDPARRGRELESFFHRMAERSFQDLEEAGLLAPAGERPRALREWECFALYACVRGLVAAGGFNRETAAAIDALHDAVLAGWDPDHHHGESLQERRSLISERYTLYGEIGQAGGASGADTVTQRLGEAAARHMTGTAIAAPELVELVGALHEALAEGAAESVRRAE